MNIFKALSGGNGKISETNITSFMNYLLDSSNELNNSFFISFLNLIDKQLDENKISEQLDLKGGSIRSQIVSFSEKYKVNAEPEYSVRNSRGDKKIPDILLKVVTSNALEDVLYIVIENKIHLGAKQNNQVKHQYDYFKDSEEYQDGLPVYSVLITPDLDQYSKVYEKGKEANELTAWLKWVNHSDIDDSIDSILRDLVKHELNAEIQPIDPNTRFILKSFIDYLATEFAIKEKGRKNRSFRGFDVVDTATTTFKNKEITLKRFSNNMIRLFDAKDDVMEVSVKPILRELNFIYSLGLDLKHATGQDKNTQVLGREVINALNYKTVSGSIELNEVSFQ